MPTPLHVFIAAEAGLACSPPLVTAGTAILFHPLEWMVGEGERTAPSILLRYLRPPPRRTLSLVGLFLSPFYQHLFEKTLRKDSCKQSSTLPTSLWVTKTFYCSVVNSLFAGVLLPHLLTHQNSGHSQLLSRECKSGFTPVRFITFPIYTTQCNLCRLHRLYVFGYYVNCGVGWHQFVLTRKVTSSNSGLSTLSNVSLYTKLVNVFLALKENKNT